MRGVSEINVFVGTSMCRVCVCVCVCVCLCVCLCATVSYQRSLLFFARQPPPGLLTRRATRTLADGKRWQGLGPQCRTPAASRQSSTQPPRGGGHSGRTHSTQRAGRQVSLKHAAGTLTSTCEDTPATTQLYTGAPDREVAKICGVIIHFWGTA